jgi:hypothetical protein
MFLWFSIRHASLNTDPQWLRTRTYLPFQNQIFANTTKLIFSRAERGCSRRFVFETVLYLLLISIDAWLGNTSKETSTAKWAPSAMGCGAFQLGVRLLIAVIRFFGRVNIFNLFDSVEVILVVGRSWS